MEAEHVNMESSFLGEEGQYTVKPALLLHWSRHQTAGPGNGVQAPWTKTRRCKESRISE